VYGAGHHTSEWIGLDDSVSFPALETWMKAQGADGRCGYRFDTMLGLKSAARCGAGRAVLPCYLADADTALVRLDEPIPALDTDLWLLVHPDLRCMARIRAVRDFVIAAFEDPGVQARLAGEKSA
jgi:DNA-binding transcriptional LysR family regulator